jgi:hypothetical protein
MGGNGKAPLLSYLPENLDETLVRKVGGGRRVCDAELPKKSFQPAVVRALRVDAQDMYALARRKLETREYVNATSCGSVPERRKTAHVVMIGDC